jgi:hypothetical protein
VVARVVHETEVIFKFRRKSNGENIFLERNWMSIRQISPARSRDIQTPHAPVVHPKIFLAAAVFITRCGRRCFPPAGKLLDPVAVHLSPAAAICYHAPVLEDKK